VCLVFVRVLYFVIIVLLYMFVRCLDDFVLFVRVVLLGFCFSVGLQFVLYVLVGVYFWFCTLWGILL